MRSTASHRLYIAHYCHVVTATDVQQRWRGGKTQMKSQSPDVAGKVGRCHERNENWSSLDNGILTLISKCVVEPLAMS
jgi:hypothetical protein